MNFESLNISWVLVDEIAVGPAPFNDRLLEVLHLNEIKNILSLCSKDEHKYKIKNDLFNHEELILPDHRSELILEISEVEKALNILERFKKIGPTYVHCLYGIERSPLICMAYLIKISGYSFQNALDYMLNIRRSTNPLSEHLKIIKTFES